MCPSREHIPVNIHMALDNGKGVLEELLKTFEECLRPIGMATALNQSRKDLPFSSSIPYGFTA